MSSGGRALPEVWSQVCRYDDDCKTEAEALALGILVSQRGRSETTPVTPEYGHTCQRGHH